MLYVFLISYFSFVNYEIGYLKMPKTDVIFSVMLKLISIIIIKKMVDPTIGTPEKGKASGMEKKMGYFRNIIAFEERLQA